MNHPEKDKLDKQIFEQLHGLEITPNAKLFEAIAAQKRNKRKPVWIWLWSASIAGIILFGSIYRFEPNPASLQKMQMAHSMPNEKNSEKPIQLTKLIKSKDKRSKITRMVQPEKKQNFAKPQMPYKKNEASFLPSIAEKITNSNNSLDVLTPIAFNANKPTTFFSDTLKVLNNMPHVCENVEIPVPKVTTLNEPSIHKNKQWWFAIQYLQFFGEGIYSSNSTSYLQPAAQQAMDYAQTTYGANLQLGKRLYKNLWAWTGLQYQRNIFAKMQAYNTYKESTINATQDAFYLEKQYFDLSYNSITLPIGIAYIWQQSKWQFKVDISAQANYLLTTNSMRYQPISKQLETSLNTSNQQRFDRNLLGANSTFNAAYRLRNNIWANIGLGASYYPRSYLNPIQYEKKPSAAAQVLVGMQYFF